MSAKYPAHQAATLSTLCYLILTIVAYRRENLKRILIVFVLGCVLVAFGTISQAATLYGVTGHGGTPSATLHIVSQTDASTTPILALNDNNGGQVIAYNPDDGFLYHWTGYPAANALYERIDLSTNSVTNIPLSGFETDEIYSATYDPAIGAFLTSDLSSHFGTVTTDGFRTNLGSTSNWVRGLAFVGNTLYGGHNSLIPVDELWTIDPANGDFLSTTPVTLELDTTSRRSVHRQRTLTRANCGPCSWSWSTPKRPACS